MASKSKKQAKAVSPVLDEVEELPDFAFIGVDGEYYHISKTPHEFVALLMKIGVNRENFTFESLNHWLWLHVKAIPSQKHLSLEDVGKLYFQCDIPHIVDCIFRRLAEAQNSATEGFKIMNSRLSEILEAPSNGQEENGSVRPAGKRRASKKQP